MKIEDVINKTDWQLLEKQRIYLHTVIHSRTKDISSDEIKALEGIQNFLDYLTDAAIHENIYKPI